jgi:hypothetical protein
MEKSEEVQKLLERAARASKKADELMEKAEVLRAQSRKVVRDREPQEPEELAKNKEP